MAPPLATVLVAKMVRATDETQPSAADLSSLRGAVRRTRQIEFGMLVPGRPPPGGGGPALGHSGMIGSELRH